ncbi:PulJ/GspJ family protein [Poritiphilus flavus]|uniref:Prepilin-type N-terminal cleavage/methylation domain-containing protein n=1 Tax=Poritiphilus flavus TaxID=2697053 RepID=A0A6L9EDR3_9FLAO|nr:hypothetical protein [Poritiphilus flavus]NAS12914.1 hypothetical protein [Poritiphilus flavus]
MLRKNLKIRAFTISEMLVVLLLTSIITGLAYGVLNLVQSQMRGIETNYSRNTELNLLRRSLWVDFNSYNHIYFDAKTATLLFENELDSRSYKFESEWIVKARDTFNIKLIVIELFQEGRPQTQGEVDAIALESSELFGGQRVFVYKKDLAVNHMNR